MGADASIGRVSRCFAVLPSPFFDTSGPCPKVDYATQKCINMYAFSKYWVIMRGYMVGELFQMLDTQQWIKLSLCFHIYFLCIGVWGRMSLEHSDKQTNTKYVIMKSKMRQALVSDGDNAPTTLSWKYPCFNLLSFERKKISYMHMHIGRVNWCVCMIWMKCFMRVS